MSPETGKMLLKLARDTVRAHLNGEKLPPLPNPADPGPSFGGAFVTLRSGRRLRGCIGLFNEHILEVYARAQVGTPVLLI